MQLKGYSFYLTLTALATHGSGILWNLFDTFDSFNVPENVQNFAHASEIRVFFEYYAGIWGHNYNRFEIWFADLAYQHHRQWKYSP